MKISKLEFENFRNFKGKECIKFSDDGRMTVIYGKNGDGKTTLHQLFRWIFYNTVQFNKTATEHLYNLSYEQELSIGTVFDVKASIEFEHRGIKYVLTRKNRFQKELRSSRKLNIPDELELICEDGNSNWKQVNNPMDVIEDCLPSGLLEYFFFDGEGMIADLKVKGSSAATKLRKTIYSLFELDVIQDAISHIGATSQSTTVLGRLYSMKGDDVSGSRIGEVKDKISDYEYKIRMYQHNINDSNNRKRIKSERINAISEEIGQNKQKINYENERRKLQINKNRFEENEKNAKREFGDKVIDIFPTLLISKAIKEAQYKIHLKASETTLPLGITKQLIHFLTSDENNECICGRSLNDEDKQVIKSLLKLMPPLSYTSMYQNFKSNALKYEKDFDESILEEKIKQIISNSEGAIDCEAEIKRLDDEEKERKDIDALIDERLELEKEVSELDKDISDNDHRLKNAKSFLNKYMKEYDNLTKQNTHAQNVMKKIEIMNKILKKFKDDLLQKSLVYSNQLEDNIQYLLNSMLTSKRNVSVSSDFAVRVTDSFNDESKSEGQFAVVSFAYIGGILKMLKEIESLQSKEYPLVLDGPFSKLDVDQRQNVVNMLPTFAPQVIIFSKDDLHDVIPNDKLGYVYTIQSNAEKNIASIKEGRLWK